MTPVSRVRVLLVDDNPGDLRLVRQKLTRFADRFECFECASLEAADARLAEQKVDVVLLDLMLPGAKGLDTLERFRAAHPGPAVVVLTGLGDEEAGAQALRRGAQDYLIKDELTPSDLGRVLRHAKDRKAASDEAIERQAALAESEARFRSMAESISQVFWISTPDKTRMLYVSPAYETIWGRSCASLLERPSGFLEAIVPEDQERVREALVKQATGEFDEVYRIRRPDGSLRWIRSRAYPIKDAAGTVTYVTGIAEDVTERETALEALRRSQQMLQTAQEVGRIGSWSGPVDGLGPVEFSQEYYRIFGLRPEEPLTWADIVKLIHPDDREAVVAARREGCKTGRYHMRYRIVRPDGAIRHVESRGERFGDRLVGVSQDVTELAAAQTALERSEATLQAAQALANIGSWNGTRAPSGPVELSTQLYRIINVPVGTPMTSQDYFRLVHPDDRAAMNAARDAVESGGYDVRYRIIRRDGEVRHVHARGRLLRGPEGERIIGTLQDVTDRVKERQKLEAAETQLRQAQKMEAVGRLAGGVAHDFNNLLTAILGLSELSLRELPEEHIVAKDLLEIRETALRAARLTQQLLAFSRRQIIEPRHVDLNDVVDGSAKMLRRIIGEDVELRISKKGGAVVVHADPHQLEQVLMNLVINARDAMPNGGVIDVRTELVEGRALLAVKDNGSGISEEVRAHLFEPFFTTKEQGKGTGLGLATCYGIVRQSGGEIVCDSAPGKGTEFRVLLPVSDARPEKPAGARKLAPGAARAEKVLVIEDEESVRRLVVRVLRERGYEILAAVDGAAGLELARLDTAREIRLVVSDTVMPRMGGMELARRLAADRPDLRVLLTSGYTDDVLLREGAAGSGVAFLRKPFTAEELALRTRELLDAPPQLPLPPR